MKKISRRTFLKQMSLGGLIAAGALCGGWKWLFPVSDDENRCTVCGAVYRRPGMWGCGARTECFCPACGVNLKTGEKQLDWAVNIRTPKTRLKKQTGWDVGELPFPNPALVKQTEKPMASLKLISRKFMKGLTGV